MSGQERQVQTLVTVHRCIGDRQGMRQQGRCFGYSVVVGSKKDLIRVIGQHFIFSRLTRSMYEKKNLDSTNWGS